MAKSRSGHRYRAAPANPEPYAFVWDLVVMPRYRNAGSGQRLLEAAEAHARHCGVSVIKIGVLSRTNGAQRLYERCGFLPYRTEICKRLA